MKSQAAKSLRNASGFTLIEMMVTAGILSVLILAFSAYMYQQAKQSQSMQNTQNVNQLKNSVLDTSSQPDALVATENAQFNGAGATAPCPIPCYIGLDPTTGNSTCVFDHYISGTPPNPVPAGCISI